MLSWARWGWWPATRSDCKWTKRRTSPCCKGDCRSLIHANSELGQVVSLQRDGSLQARALLTFHHASDGSNAEWAPSKKVKAPVAAGWAGYMDGSSRCVQDQTSAITSNTIGSLVARQKIFTKRQLITFEAPPFFMCLLISQNWAVIGCLSLQTVDYLTKSALEMLFSNNKRSLSNSIIWSQTHLSMHKRRREKRWNHVNQMSHSSNV